MSLYGNVGSIIGTVGGAFLGPIGAAVGGTVGSLTGNLIEGLKKPKYETITQRTYLNNNPYQGYLYGMPSLERKETYLRQVKEPSQAYQRAEQATGVISMGLSTATSYMNPKQTVSLKDLFSKIDLSPKTTQQVLPAENILQKTKNIVNYSQGLKWNLEPDIQIPKRLTSNPIIPYLY